ncbi:MAG: 4-alpha-glucanotransferase [Dongiaceae bacterium]
MSAAALARLAERAGLALGYHDGFGKWREPADADLEALLGALGLDLSGGPQAALAALDAAARGRALPPVLVLRRGADAWQVPVDLPRPVPARLAWTLHREDGVVESGEVRTAALVRLPAPRGAPGRAGTRRALPLAADLPTGYHRLSLPALGAETLLAIAPSRCHQPAAFAEGRRLWGLSVQLYGLRSRRNWGIGDFTDLARLATLAGRHGAAFVGLNPLHARCPFRPEDGSPYAPSDRRFLDILSIDVEALPEIREDRQLRRRIAGKRFQARLAALRAPPLVDYPGVAAAKLPLLEAAWEVFRIRHLARNTARADEYRRFVADGGEALRRFALFLALREEVRARTGAVPGWRDWPAELQDPASPAVAAFAESHAPRLGLQLYLQWQAELQLAAAAVAGQVAGLAVGLYRDLAVGAGADGAECWSGRALLADGSSVGAPPDAYNAEGQNWGLPPWRPGALAAAGYGPFLEMLRANMRHAGALRIDHAMALKRLFWIPAGRRGASGSYVAYPFADLAALVALESERHRCLVIGEDLGSVPEGFRETLAELGILSYRVLWFERDGGGGFLPPERYPAQAIAIPTTHDLPTLAGFWTGRDIATRTGLGLYPDDAMRGAAVADRTADRARLAAALAAADLPAPDPEAVGEKAPPGLADAVHGLIGRTAAGLAAVQLDDVLGAVDAVNLPGTFREYPNWRHKLDTDLEDLEDDPRLASLARVMHEAGRG